jgi:hypothetical protein
MRVSTLNVTSICYSNFSLLDYDRRTTFSSSCGISKMKTCARLKKKTAPAFLFQQFGDNRHSCWPHAVATSLTRLHAGCCVPLGVSED